MAAVAADGLLVVAVVALTEIAVVGKQLANLTQFDRQFGDLVQHRLELLLVVWRLHYIVMPRAAAGIEPVIAMGRPGSGRRCR